MGLGLRYRNHYLPWCSSPSQPDFWQKSGKVQKRSSCSVSLLGGQERILKWWNASPCNWGKCRRPRWTSWTIKLHTFHVYELRTGWTGSRCRIWGPTLWTSCSCQCGRNFVFLQYEDTYLRYLCTKFELPMTKDMDVVDQNMNLFPLVEKVNWYLMFLLNLKVIFSQLF